MFSHYQTALAYGDYSFSLEYAVYLGTHSNVNGWGAMSLSLNKVIDFLHFTLIPPVTLWPWGLLSL
jgi:hypothetical protein